MIPQMKAEVKVCFSSEDRGFITFYATVDAMTTFQRFGSVEPTRTRNKWMIFVDPRYDFGEVLQYIQDHEKKPPQIEFVVGTGIIQE